MTTGMTQLEVPYELRVAAARSLEQAKLTLDAYMRVTEEAASMFEKRIEGGQVGTKEAGKKAINFALQNATAAFEFAQKIAQAKDVPEFVRLLNEFLQSQMKVLSEQVKDLGETLSRVAAGSMNVAKKNELVS
ncbi:MAG: phasin family protein [Rhodoplanes sp.]